MNGTLDHVVFAWEDLDEIIEVFTRLGLVPDYGGVHDELGTEMAILGFEDGSYLELIAPVDHERPPRQWPDNMFAAGPCRWCLRSDDLRAELTRLRDTGATVSGPERRTRERPDGRVVAYEAAVYGTDGDTFQFPFLLRDLTPHRYRVQPSDSLAESSLTGIAKIVIAVKDIDEAIEKFNRLYAFPSPDREVNEEFGAALARFPGEPTILAEPLDDATWLASRVAAYPSYPCSFLLQTADFTVSTREFPVTDSIEIFGSRTAWFDSPVLVHKIGMMEQ